MWKSRIIYFSIIIAGFIFSQALYDSVSFLTLIVLIAFPFISILLSAISYPLVNVKIFSTNNSLCRFDKFTLRIKMCNSSPFVAPVFNVYCSLPDENGKTIDPVRFVLNAPCARHGYFDYVCFFANRGVYELSVDCVEYYDFLKLIKIKKRLNSKISVISQPATIKLPMSINAQRQNQDNSNVLGTSPVLDGGDMMGVRDYVYGDNLKNAHWKLSSKYDNIVMKSFAEDIYDQAYIVVDMSSYYNDYYTAKSMSDCVVESALSIIHSYQKNSIRFSVVINLSKTENKTFRVSSAQQLFEVESFISMLPYVEDSDISDVLRGVNVNAASGAEVCIITSFGSNDVKKHVKKYFIDVNTKVNIINISLYNDEETDGIINYSKDYIENQIKGLK